MGHSPMQETEYIPNCLVFDERMRKGLDWSRFERKQFVSFLRGQKVSKLIPVHILITGRG